MGTADQAFFYIFPYTDSDEYYSEGPRNHIREYYYYDYYSNYYNYYYGDEYGDYYYYRYEPAEQVSSPSLETKEGGFRRAVEICEERGMGLANPDDFVSLWEIVNIIGTDKEYHQYFLLTYKNERLLLYVLDQICEGLTTWIRDVYKDEPSMSVAHLSGLQLDYDFSQSGSSVSEQTAIRPNGSLITSRGEEYRQVLCRDTCESEGNLNEQHFTRPNL